MFWILALCLIGVYGIRRLLDYRRAVKGVRNFPGYRTLFSPTSAVGLLLDPIPGITQGRNHCFLNKHDIFKRFGWDAYYAVGALPSAGVALFLADAVAIKEVTSARQRFPKPGHPALNFFGPNLASAEGKEYKRFLKITNPSFTEPNHKVLWEEATKVMTELFNDAWAGQNVITIDHATDLTLTIPLFVFSAAAFGRPMSWKTYLEPVPGHKLRFSDALFGVSSKAFPKLLTPGWALRLTESLHRIGLTYNEFQQYMDEMIEERRAHPKGGRVDLFGSLLAAHESGNESLTYRELIGNMFIFFFGGHETTGHTLALALGLLSLYPSEQEKVYQQIREVIDKNSALTYDHIPLLTRTLAVLYETLRLFPPLAAIPKYSAEDTTLMVSNAEGQTTVLPIAKGTPIILDAAGVHYNPRYWEDPHEFKPSRFLKDWPKDAFLPFSAGARVCIGKKFFDTEGTTILAMLLLNYTVEVKDEPQFMGESSEAKKARVLACQPGVTLTPIRVPLVFKRKE